MVRPAARDEEFQEFHAGEVGSLAVGGVGGEAPAPVALTDVLFAESLSGRVVDDEWRVDEQHRVCRGVIVQPGRIARIPTSGEPACTLQPETLHVP